MKFKDVQVGQRFIYKKLEYLKVTEMKKSCCKIEYNAIKLQDNSNILFEYKAEVELVND